MEAVEDVVGGGDGALALFEIVSIRFHFHSSSLGGYMVDLEVKWRWGLPRRWSLQTGGQ